MREEWKNLHEGIDNVFRIAVLDMGIKYQQISVSNKESQFVESKAVTVEDIARFFGVPLYKLMAGKQAYDSNEQNGIEYVVNTLHPIVSQYEEEDSYKLPLSRMTRAEVRARIFAWIEGYYKMNCQVKCASTTAKNTSRYAVHMDKPCQKGGPANVSNSTRSESVVELSRASERT